MDEMEFFGELHIATHRGVNELHMDGGKGVTESGSVMSSMISSAAETMECEVPGMPQHGTPRGECAKQM